MAATARCHWNAQQPAKGQLNGSEQSSCCAGERFLEKHPLATGFFFMRQSPHTQVRHEPGHMLRPVSCRHSGALHHCSLRLPAVQPRPG